MSEHDTNETDSLDTEDETSLLDDPEAMYSALWVIVGVLVLFVARRTYGALFQGGMVSVLMVTQLFLTGTALVILATWEPIDLRRWSRPMAAWVIWTLLAVGIYNFLLLPSDWFASDVSLFESWAGHLLILGRNPMAENMLVARQAWNTTGAPVTNTTTGGNVSVYSYPGGTLWITAAEATLPYHRLGLGPLLASIAFLSWLVLRVRRAFVPVALIVFMAPTVRPISASLGMITPLWLFPLAVGLAAWYDGRLDVAAVGFGAAAVSKQLSWAVAGLALLHVGRVYGPRVVARMVAIASGVGAALVGYLVVWNPRLWLRSALFPLVPVGDPLVAQGAGLTSLTVAGVYTVPRSLHAALVATVAVGLIVATWRYPDPMRWVIPFAPILVMVVHYRTLPSYYTAVLPLAVVALDARLRSADRTTPRWVRAVARLIASLQRRIPEPPDRGEHS